MTQRISILHWCVLKCYHVSHKKAPTDTQMPPKGPCVEALAFPRPSSLCHTHGLLAPMGSTTPASPLGLCIDLHSSYNGSSKTDTMQAASLLRSLVLLQPLLMQLMYYLAESVIRTCTIPLLVWHNMGCCHFPWLLAWRQITWGME